MAGSRGSVGAHLLVYLWQKIRPFSPPAPKSWIMPSCRVTAPQLRNPLRTRNVSPKPAKIPRKDAPPEEFLASSLASLSRRAGIRIFLAPALPKRNGEPIAAYPIPPNSSLRAKHRNRRPNSNCRLSNNQKTTSTRRDPPQAPPAAVCPIHAGGVDSKSS